MRLNGAMTRYADPQRCPDCRHPISFDNPVCPTCGLPLRGPLVAELFQTLTAADALLARVRATVAVAPPAEDLVSGLTPGAGAEPPPPRVRRGLSAASVPQILLGLGAVCLLVAAVVFLAVTWSAMGVGGRTATLAGFTLVTGGLAAWTARRALRGAAESLSLVALGLLAMDVFGARTAGWLGDLSPEGLLILLGAVLVGAGGATAVVGRRTPVGRLTAPQLVAGAGVLLLSWGIADLAGGSAESLIAATVVAGLCAMGAARIDLPLSAVGAAVVAGLAWVGQLLAAIEAVDEATVRTLWVDLDGWQLLVSAALAATPALMRSLPLPGRVAAAAVGLGVLSLAVALPALDEGPTALGLAALVAAVAVGALGWLLPRPWGLSALLTQVVSAAGLVVVVVEVAGTAGTRLLMAAAATWSGLTGDHLPGGPPADLPAPWLAPLAVLGLLGTGAALTRASATVDSRVSWGLCSRAGTGLVAAAAGAALACYPVPVWSLLLALVAAGGGFLAMWLVRRHGVLLTFGSLFVLAAGMVGWYDEWLTVLALTALLCAAGLVHLRAHDVATAAVAGAAVPVALTGIVWTSGALLDAAGPWVALAGLLLLSTLVLGLPSGPRAWWVSDATPARTGVEAGVASGALMLGALGVITGPTAEDATWAAVYLTVAGATVVAQSLLRADRRPMAWPGSALLMLASWVRLVDLDVTEPEPYTMPAAVALVLFGLVRLRRDPDADTLRALGPGLALALLPSLLWALEEPVTLRGLLLGLGCLGLVLGALHTRWAAPLLLGAGVGAVLVFRMAAPYLGDAVPRWVLIGGAGALLMVVGITWERRLQEARQMMGLMRALR